MPNDLVATPDLLVGLPGAPFTFEEVDAAVANVRAAAEWHIAPQKTETVTLDVSPRESRLRLPTRHLISVAAVRNADTDALIASSLYRVSVKHAQVKKRSGCWPSGFQAVEVDMTHGFTTTPLELLAVVAEAANLARREQAITSVQIDDFHQQFGATVDSGMLGTSDALRRYSLTGNPLYGLGIA